MLLPFAAGSAAGGALVAALVLLSVVFTTAIWVYADAEASAGARSSDRSFGGLVSTQDADGLVRGLPAALRAVLTAVHRQPSRA
jgi:hypothetical protein